MMRYGFLIAASLAALAVTATAQQVSVTPPDSKLTTVLADLVAASGSSTTQLSESARPTSVRNAMQARRLRIDANNEVQVYILMAAVTDDTVGQLTAAGVTIEIRDAARRRVQARLPVSRLTAVAQLAVVDAIRLPTYARARAGNTLTEGDAILHADAVRAQFGLDGTGVRVGVVSDGIKGVFATGCTTGCAGVDGGPIATGDLPGATATRTSAGVLKESSGGIVGRSFSANGDLEGLPPASPACAFAGAGAEGTALLEIVHDLAPGAKLSFANGDTDLAFSQAVNFLAASNDVVLDDIGFFGEPYDGTSAVSANTAAALNNPGWPIRAYVTAVGNDADEHYFGAYADSGVDGTSISGITPPGHLHLFQRTSDTTDVLGLGSQPFNVIALPQNGEVAIFLTWDDAFGGSGNNYDLYLVQQSTGRVVARSTDVQSGRQDPSEVIDYVNTGAADRFLIVVQNVGNAAQPRNLNIFSFQPECAAAGPALLAPPRHERHNYNTASRSISAQGDAGGSPVSVIAVGAICSASASAAGGSNGAAPDESCLDTSNVTPEFFSSRGPTLDGRLKPDIMAIDGVAVSGAGSFPAPFFGTSAAAPHLGGVAALMLQSAPCLLNRTTSTIAAAGARTTVRNLLIGKTFPLSPAPDNDVGAGRADAF
ncbi:MAG: S8 family serine peptidase, partial [Vicinamibacterales bacterium]